MSNYSQGPSYGANPNPPFLPPAYPNQYLQADDGNTNQGQMASNYDSSMNTYTYNRGAPAFSAAAVASGVPPLPIFQGWNQDSVPLPPYIVPQSAGQYNNSYGSNGQIQSQPYYPPSLQPGYQHQPHALQNKPHEQDLSEGEFEDGAVVTSNPAVGYGAIQHREHDGTGYIDTAQRAVYPRAQEYNPQQSYTTNNYNYAPRDHSQVRHQQPDSYSPYASPSVQINAERTNGAHHHKNAYALDQSQDSNINAPIPTPAQSYKWPQKSVYKAELEPSINGHNTPQNQDKASHRARDTPAQPKPTPAVGMNGIGSAPGKLVAESRKNAQGAIQSLWPYGLRLQTYIDEGFKEDLVKSLMNEANLLGNSLADGNDSEHDGVPQASNLRESQYQRSGLQNPSKSENNIFASPQRVSKNISQDPIAPLSVTTNGNLATKAMLGQTPISQIKIPVAAATPKSVSMIEKDKALKSKMDALRKSREDRAQKAAAKSIPSAAVADLVAVRDELTKIPAEDGAALEEITSAQATTSLSKSPSVPKIDIQPVANTFPVAKDKADLEKLTKTAAAQHQLPAIPGLFLASAVASPAAAPQVQVQRFQSPVHGHHRKRPVAADFDAAVSSMAPLKRPFGQNRNDKPLVIDISEEEIDSDDEDVAMDLESIADDSPAQPTRNHLDHLVSTAQLQTTTNSLTQPKPWSPPSFSSAASTPPSSQVSRGAFGRPEILQRKESEIEELKKKIAEAVAKKKKSKHSSSGTRTPRQTDTLGAVDGNSTPLANGVATQLLSSAIVEELADGQEMVAQEQRGHAELRSLELMRASEQKRITVEQKRMQLHQMASDLAALKAAGQQKLAEIARRKAEVEEMEALRMASLEDQQRIEEQMLLLGQQEDNELEAVDVALHDTLVTTPVEAQSNSVADSPKPSSTVAETLDESIAPINILSDGLVPPAPAQLRELVEPSSESTENTTQVDERCLLARTDQYATVDGASLPIDHVDKLNTTDDSKAVLTADQTLEAALQEAVRIEADSHVHTEEDTDTALPYTIKSSEVVQDTIPEPADDVLKSPDYSPELRRDIPEILERESDDYEPPEASPPANAPDFEMTNAADTTGSPSPINSPPFSPAPPADVSEPTEPTGGMVLTLDSLQAVSEKATEGESSSKELSLASGRQTTIAKPRVEPADRLQTFTPYESPLKHFRAYRFHPQFKKEISGGLKSMTYSHRINPNKELCRFELAGGICNDTTCDLQHFREIGLPDDAVLTALGSPDEFQGEQRERFCMGLKEVLLKMRMNRVRDFNIIAAEIIAHRVKFLGDSSKVLPLEGINI